MLSSGVNVIIVSSGAYVIIWCYHVMLSSGMITHPFFIFPENFTHSFRWWVIIGVYCFEIIDERVSVLYNDLEWRFLHGKSCFVILRVQFLIARGEEV